MSLIVSPLSPRSKHVGYWVCIYNIHIQIQYTMFYRLRSTCAVRNWDEFYASWPHYFSFSMMCVFLICVDDMASFHWINSGSSPLNAPNSQSKSCHRCVVASASALKIGTAGTSTIVDLWNKAMRCKLSAVRVGEEWEISAQFMASLRANPHFLSVFVMGSSMWGHVICQSWNDKPSLFNIVN